MHCPRRRLESRLKGNFNWTFGGSGYRHVWVHKNGGLFFGAAKESDFGDSGAQSIGTVVAVTPGTTSSSSPARLHLH